MADKGKKAESKCPSAINPCELPLRSESGGGSQKEESDLICKKGSDGKPTKEKEPKKPKRKKKRMDTLSYEERCEEHRLNAEERKTAKTCKDIIVPRKKSDDDSDDDDDDD